MANYLGLEIAGDAVRGALVRTQLRGAQLVRLIEVPIVPVGAAHEQPLQDPFGTGGPSEAGPEPNAELPAAVADPVREAVLELLRRVGGPVPSIIASLPGEDASIRKIELPAAAARRIDELLPFEMEALVPFDAEETMLDHQPLETTPSHLRVLVAAVLKARVRARLDQLAAWAIDPQELAVGAAALDGIANMVPTLAGEGPYLLVHLSQHRTDVCFLRARRCELARTLRAGSADLALAGFATSPAFGSTAARLWRELKQTMAAWRAQGGEPPLAVMVSGRDLEDPRTSAWLSEAIGQSVELLAVPDTQPMSGLDALARARFGMALALASRAITRARRIDLRKGEFVAQRSANWVRDNARTIAACAVAIMVAFTFSSYARWSVLNARRAALEAQLSQVTLARLGQATTSPQQARVLLEAGSGRGDPMPRFTAFDALSAISVAVGEALPDAETSPHDIQRLQIDLGDDRSGGHFELAGVVGSIEARDQIAQALARVECFRELELGPLTQAPNDRRNYRIEADVLCPGDAPPESERRGRTRGGSSRSGGGSR